MTDEQVAGAPSPRELETVADPAAFGLALRQVRRHRGLTLRGMEQYLRGLTDRPPDRWSKSKIEQAEKGRALEERWVLRYLQAVGLPGADLPPWVMALRRVLAQPETGTVEEASPFPGLRAFGVEQHRVFFARNREVGELAGLLRSPAERADAAVLLVMGPSGCGKSSLVRAGLVPAMARTPGWLTLAPFWPGSDPVGALARELTAAATGLGLEWSLPEVRRRLDDDGEGGGPVELVEELLLAAPGPRRTRLLIAVDQFEELLTHAPPAPRARFVALLGAVLEGPAAVVATMSPEFFDALLGSDELAALATHVVTVRPLEREALAVVIEQPARVAGIEVEPELVARLVADTAGGDALPLLAYTLAQLAEGVERGGRLESARYERLGGVHGTLARQADRALDEATALSGRGRGQVLGSLLRLVTVDENGRPTRWRVPRDELPDVVVTELGPFLARRLLTTDAEREGGVTVQVAHEAFLSAWAPLARAIADDSTALRARRTVEQAAAVWDADQRAPARLWERGQLAAALADTGARHRATGLLGPREVVSERVALSAPAREFLGASIRRDRRRRGRATTVLALLLVLALAATGVAVAQRDTARDQQRLATARLLVSRAEADRTTDQRAALLLGETAAHLHPDDETRASLAQTLLANHYRATLPDHTGPVNAVAFSPDGHILATAGDDHAVILTDLTDPAAPRRIGSPLTGHTGTVTAVAFSPDGRTLATGGDDHTVLLWNLTDPAAPARTGAPVTGFAGTVSSVAFSPDGRTLAATGDAGGAVALLDLTAPGGPRRAPPPPGPAAEALAVAFSPDGHTVAVGLVDGSVALLDRTDPGRPRRGPTLPGHTRVVLSVAFSPDGHTLASGGADDTAVLWDLTDPAAPRGLGAPLTGHSNAVASVAFSPDGHTLATGSADQTTILWDLTEPGRPRRRTSLTGHTGTVHAVAFSPDGHTVATGSADQTAILWDLSEPGRPRRRASLGGHTSAVYSVAFSRDGRTLATASNDGTVVLWDLTDPDAPRPGRTLGGHGGAAVVRLAFSPDGHTLATGGADGDAVLWDLTDPASPRPRATLPGYTLVVHAVAFSPDGRTLAVSGSDGAVVLWDVTDPAAPRQGPTLGGRGGAVYAVAFAPDGHTLAVGGSDRTAVLWDLTAPGPPHPRATLAAHSRAVNTLAFSPDGRTLATGSDDHTVVLWDPATGRPLPESLPNGHTGAVVSVAFSPDGHVLATASGDTTVILWDLTTPGPRSRGPTLTGHTGAVVSAAFSPDGRTLATAGSDTTTNLWENLTAFASIRDQAAARACALTGAMSPADWARFVPGLAYEDSCAPG